MHIYKVVRYYESGRHTTIKRNLSEAEAQAHCSDPETSWSTCKKAANKRRTQLRGRWFDGYTTQV